MQMQQGLMPGGVPSMGGSQYSPNMMGGGGQPPTTQNTSNQLQQQQQQISNFVSPPPFMGGGVTPMARPGPIGQYGHFPRHQLPPPQFGTGRTLARQSIQGEANQMIGGAQSAAGIGARGMVDMAATGAGRRCSGWRRL